jgi:hypothetical protein
MNTRFRGFVLILQANCKEIMIQRRQTIFLLGIIVLQIVLFFVTLLSANNASTHLDLTLYTNQYTNAAGNQTPVHDGFNIWMTSLNVIVIIFALVDIFLYRKRQLQLRVSRFTGLLIIVLIGTMFFAAEEAKKHLGADVNFSYQAGIFLPIISLILIILAGRGIISDERLVRSADRLR